MSEPPSSGPSGADEAPLLAALGRALDPDPPPPGLVARAMALIGWAGVDRDLARLLDEGAAELAGVRGPGPADDRLVFEARGGALTIEVTVAGGVRGQVLAGRPAEVTLEPLRGEPVTVGVDGLGRFSFEPVTAGPARLRLHGSWARSVTTDWFLISDGVR